MAATEPQMAIIFGLQTIPHWHSPSSVQFAILLSSSPTRPEASRAGLPKSALICLEIGALRRRRRGWRHVGRNRARDRFAAPSNDDVLAGLDPIEELAEPAPCFKRSDLFHSAFNSLDKSPILNIESDRPGPQQGRPFRGDRRKWR